ncbi:hypothetical protein T484DRAFT_1856319 [Baffinella frigidus]|nr:hypothetical protein T484DRAFT_1856319 [Cryptophyta sp. CCMP2293]
MLSISFGEDEPPGRQVPATAAASSFAGRREALQKRHHEAMEKSCDFDMSLDKDLVTSGPPKQKTLAEARLSRLQSQPGGIPPLAMCPSQPSAAVAPPSLARRWAKKMGSNDVTVGALTDARSGAPAQEPVRFGRWQCNMKATGSTTPPAPSSSPLVPSHAPATQVAREPHRGASSAQFSASCSSPAQPRPGGSECGRSTHPSADSAASKAPTPLKEQEELGGRAEAAGEKRERAGARGRERSPGRPGNPGVGSSAQSSPARSHKRRKALSYPPAVPAGSSGTSAVREVRETLTGLVTLFLSTGDPAAATMRKIHVCFLALPQLI